jgi:CDP-diacylglycerol--glycerol-3-phosphate 3-phosphatidyltransferase
LVNLPTLITFGRIFLIPLFVFFVYSKPLFGVFIFVFASATDILDGYIARKSRQVTKFGVLLDPIADKLLIISALIVLVDITPIAAWIVIIIIAREFIVTGLRVIALSRDIIIPAEMGGKIKMMAQFTSIVALLLDHSHIGIDLYGIGIGLLWVAMIIGIVSGVQYFVLFRRRLS